ncbi:L,D-transpeptidase family protein [Ruegeria pomeroyi]|uniref:L,D-transpeptidase family protein n=1 Tax=Ruegeria pomeroyi TaxID=89184 RepID=A0A9Q3ZLI8_9RHOB|nr:L,D-transpeptidase family protein [Ruegeria pomeroyi]MCE8535981.1 L,D-transpeptidase family protein [Ruegeria pomeroyi]
MPHLKRPRLRLTLTALLLAGVAAFGSVGAADAQVTAYKQAVAEASYGDDGVAAFYRRNGYQPVWTGEGAEFTARRAALIEALSMAEVHGLPAGRYDIEALRAQMASARTTRDMGLVEVALSREFARFARDLQTGLLTPSQIDDGMVREVERRGAEVYLTELQASQPARYMRGLAPDTAQYRALLKLKLDLEHALANGGWGPTVSGGKLEPGNSGPRVVALRNRLIAMGYMERSAVASYDGTLQKAVQAFQLAHGLEPDGVAGDGTLDEINKSVADRLKSVIVGLERERWLPRDRGERHILVNQTDFTAKIVDHGRVTFETRSVIGKNVSDRRSPEFSDEMEHMVINPSWYVPRSIITKEYLPKLRANPNAVRHLEITDSRGRQVNRGAVDFSQFSSRSFPFAMRQPPGKSNALGLVKFMFPNKYNIYLHDTPQKHLFAREVRAYSHGCIRLAQPFEFAYALLALQETDPKAFFHNVLNTGRETKVDLERHVPVHIIYRTAVVDDRGQPGYRRDVYGRDAKIWDALSRAGVVLSAVQG